MWFQFRIVGYIVESTQMPLLATALYECEFQTRDFIKGRLKALKFYKEVKKEFEDKGLIPIPIKNEAESMHGYQIWFTIRVNSSKFTPPKGIVKEHSNINKMIEEIFSTQLIFIHNSKQYQQRGWMLRYLEKEKKIYQSLGIEVKKIGFKKETGSKNKVYTILKGSDIFL